MVIYIMYSDIGADQELHDEVMVGAHLKGRWCLNSFLSLRS